jgi:pimeloyl-ACP methyl ester carboxylesterase
MTVVLVHGAWHGAWCWAAVAAGLDELDIPVVAVDLPGHGASTLPLGDLHGDADHVRSVLDGIDGEVVLVGHSYGGAVITDAGTHPTVRRLVYIAAFAPDEGEALIGIALDHSEQGELGTAIQVRDDDTNVIDPAVAREVFYGDCKPEDVDRAVALLGPQPGSSFSQPVRAVAWRSVPTTYVVCGADQAVPPSLQRFMAERIPDVAIVELADSSHSPFLSRPGDVVDILAGLVADGAEG